MNRKNMQVSMQVQTSYRSSWSRVTESLCYRFWKIPKKVAAVESYFRAVTNLPILLIQDPTTGVFVKFAEIFRTYIFMQHLKTAASEFIDSSHSSCPFFPALIVLGTRGGLTSLGRVAQQVKLLRLEQDDPGSNPAGRSVGLRDPALLRGS